MHRILKQFLYGAFYLACWAILGFLVYILFLKPIPSCFDHIQNQGEIGVDCGGPCAGITPECTPLTLQPLSAVGSVSLLPIDARHVSVFAEVVNPNATFAAENFNYSFTFYNSAGVSTTVISGISYAYAGEVKYLALPNVLVSALPAAVDLTLGSTIWVSAAEFKKPNVVLQNYTTMIAPSGNLEVDGRITNQDTVPFNNVLLVAVFYGSPATNPIGVSETDIMGLDVNASKSFTILHPNILGVDFIATKVFAYTYHP